MHTITRIIGTDLAQAYAEYRVALTLNPKYLDSTDGYSGLRDILIDRIKRSGSKLKWDSGFAESAVDEHLVAAWESNKVPTLHEILDFLIAAKKQQRK